MQQLFETILMTGIYGNSAERILLAGLTFLVLCLLFSIILPYLLKHVHAAVPVGKKRAGVIVLEYLEHVPLSVWSVVALMIALRSLDLTPRGDFIVSSIFLAMVVIMGVLLLRRILEYAIGHFMHRSDGDQALPTIFSDLISIVLWILAILLILSNVGVNITSLVAGLGISGIAVALASQRILGDIFSSFSIYFDKPFREGDYIVTGDHSGFVRKIGLKTTRIQAVSGEEVVIPNQELTQARVRNFKHMQERHVEFDLLVAPDTSSEMLRKIPDIVQTIMQPIDQLRFQRATLTKIAKAALTFTIVYDVKNSDHVSYINLLQEINLRILEEFRKEGILLG